MRCPFNDPILFKWGPFVGSWYGLMTALAMVTWYVITRSEFLRKGGPVQREEMPELLFHGLVGAILGARLGYVLICNFNYFLATPWEIFAFWDGGMSFHGSLVGMVVGGLIFVRRHHYPVGEVADATFVGIPLGLMFVKIGNFINCESFGRVTELPWGVVFPKGGHLPRHPLQLYEAFLEGPVLFAILWGLRSKTKTPGEICHFFLIGYGAFRFVTEFFRDPDPHHGFVLYHFTMGQILSLIMIAVGIGFFIYNRTRPAV